MHNAITIATITLALSINRNNYFSRFFRSVICFRRSFTTGNRLVMPTTRPLPASNRFPCSMRCVWDSAACLRIMECDWSDSK